MSDQLKTVPLIIPGAAEQGEDPQLHPAGEAQGGGEQTAPETPEVPNI
jgi:hypothetical protein